MPNFKPLYALLAALVLPVAAAAQPSVDAKKIIADLGKTPRPHPYLLFTAEEKPALLARIKADRHSAESLERYLLEGRRLLQLPVVTEGPPRILHTRFEGSDEYRRFVAEHTNAAFTLAFVYQITGDPAYAAKAYEHAAVTCAQESWVQSAHYFDIIYSRVWPYGAKDDIVVFTYDITASATSQRMAYIYDWLYPALPKAQRDRIRNALLEKAITRVRGSYDYFWWSTAYKCNWSGICHTGLGMAALALLDEDPNLTDVIARSHEGISAMLDHIGEEGGWQEGRGYWAYGVGESVRFIDALKRVTGGQVNLFKHRALATHPLDFGLFGLTGAFGDGAGTPVGESFVLNKLVQEAGDPVGAWYIQNFTRPRDEILDLIWGPTTVQPAKPTETSRHFRNIDWAVLRRDFNADSITIATKAGMNDDPHHGHLDVGTLNLTWQNLTFVGEVPRTPYDEKYFGAERWQYLEARTAGHNVVMVNGEEQLEAKLKDQPWREGIGGKITHYVSEPTFAAVAMDNTHAYPGRELKGWSRSIALDKDTNVVVVVDRVRCAPGAEIEVRFHPGVEFELGKNSVTLHPTARSTPENAGRTQRNPSVEQRERNQPRGGRVQLGNTSARSDLLMLPLVATGEATVVQGRQPDMPMTKEENLMWVPYFSTVLKAPQADNVIVTVFHPKAAAGAAGEFTLSGDAAVPVVSYSANGKNISFSFASEKITRNTR
jgi:hypothetical protein